MPMDPEPPVERTRPSGPPAPIGSYVRRAMAAREFAVDRPREGSVVARGERDAVRGAQNGSVSDLEALFRSHWPRAYRAAYLVVHDSAAAEDIAQEAFLGAIRALPRFDSRRPFGPWLHRIVVNRAIDWARSRQLRREVEPGIEPVATEEMRDALSDDVVRALAAVSPEHRAVIVLRYLLEYTPGEIAKLLGLPRGTVNSRLRRGLDELARRLPKEAP